MFNSATPVQKVSLIVMYVVCAISVYFYVTDLSIAHNLFVTWLNAWFDVKQWMLAVPAGICSAVLVMEELKK